MIKSKSNLSELAFVSLLMTTFLIFHSLVSTAATTFYVDSTNASASDSNPGTQALPWKTINKASQVMIGGDTTLVTGGPYTEKIVTTRNGTSGNRITFKAVGSIVTSGGLGINHAFNTVAGFTFKNDVTITASNCELLNNYLLNARVSMPSGNPSNCLIKGNHIESTNSWGGDWVAFDLDGSNHILESNEIGPSKDTDAFRPFGTGHIIRNNYIHDITLSPGSGAHMDIFQVFADNGETANTIIFENNTIINSQGQMFMTSMDGLTTIHDFDVRNNLWVNVAMQGNIGIPNFRFYGNTLYNVGAANGFALYLFDAGNASDPSHARIINNIFIGAGGLNTTSVDGAYAIAKGTDVITDYNLISSGPSTGYAKVSGFSEAHGINGGDPKFVSLANLDFRLQNTSPAIDKGTSLSGFAYDHNGLARPQGLAWDIGAFEYSAPGSALALKAPTNLRLM